MCHAKDNSGAGTARESTRFAICALLRDHSLRHSFGNLPKIRAGDAHRVIKSKSYDLPPLVLPYAAAIASISTSHSGSARLSTTASVLAGKCPASLNTRARIS
jgi:hypothetical protein